LAILAEVAGGLNPYRYSPLAPLRLFLDLLDAGHYTACGVTEKFVGPDKHNKPHLLAEKIQWRRAQSAGGQALLHCGKAPFVRAQGEKLYFLVRISAKMPKYQPSHRLKSAAGGVESNCFTFQLLNGFEFRPHDERAG